MVAKLGKGQDDSPKHEVIMDLKNLISKSIETNKPVKISPKLSLAAQQKSNQVFVKLSMHGNLIWTDSNTLDKIAEDLAIEIDNYG